MKPECLKKQVLGQAVLGSILAGSAHIFTVQVASHSAWVCKHRNLLYRRVSEFLLLSQVLEVRKWLEWEDH